VPAIGFWKMFDNLRRTLSAPAAIVALLAGWTLPLPAALVWTGFVLLVIALPTLLPIAGALLPRHAGITLRSHVGALGTDVASALRQSALLVAFLAHHAWLMVDAIGRTLFRLVVTQRHMLEWITAAQSKSSLRAGWLGL
jgi:cyclic beta-1,2-glucan synthetase